MYSIKEEKVHGQMVFKVYKEGVCVRTFMSEEKAKSVVIEMKRKDFDFVEEISKDSEEEEKENTDIVKKHITKREERTMMSTIKRMKR